MTSAARTSERRSGFTLIELVVVLAIAGLVLGGAIGLMVHTNDERALRGVSSEIEMMAKRARATAILQQTPYALEFTEGHVKMMPLAEAGRIERETASGRRIVDEGEEASGGEHSQLALDSDIELAVRRWGSDAWLPVEKRSLHVWRFDPDGLCEPIAVRLVRGNSWGVDVFHPLTAAIRESEYEVR